jgi:hypothetical protein
MVSGRIASAEIIGPDLHLLSRAPVTVRSLSEQHFFQDGEKERAVARPLASFSWVAHHWLPYFLSRRETALAEVRPGADFSFQPQTVPRQGNAFVKRHEHYDVEGPQLERYRTRRVGRPAASWSPSARGRRHPREPRGDLVDVSGYRHPIQLPCRNVAGKGDLPSGEGARCRHPVCPRGCHGGDNDRGWARSPFCRRSRQPIVAGHVQRCSRLGYRSRVGGRIAGWGLVRTHAAGAARVLPRPATPRPPGATPLAPGAPPDAGLLGAGASRIPATEGGRAVP